MAEVEHKTEPVEEPKAEPVEEPEPAPEPEAPKKRMHQKTR